MNRSAGLTALVPPRVITVTLIVTVSAPAWAPLAGRSAVIRGASGSVVKVRSAPWLVPPALAATMRK